MEINFVAKDGTEFLLRELRKTDAPLLLRWINEIIEEAPVGLPRLKKKTINEEKEWVEKNLELRENKKGVLFVVEKDDKIVGAIEISPEPGIDYSHYTTFHITILKQFRGKGLGTFMLKSAMGWVKENMSELDFIKIDAFSNNRAIDLYKRLGFKKVATIPKKVKRRKEYLDEIVMYYYLD